MEAVDKEFRGVVVLSIGYAYVVADMFHVGHLKHIAACKGLCDKLIVGVLTDEATMEKKPRPIIPFEERLVIVASLQWVDVAIRQETYSPLPNVRQLKADILFESTSHADEAIDDASKTMMSLNGRLIVMPYYAGTSSTSIKKKILKEWRPTNESG